jgi:hypothetical protein
VLVLSSTVSADGSIGGVYDAGLKLAERTTGQTEALSREIRPASSEQNVTPPPPPQKHGNDQQQEHSGAKQDASGHNNR